MKLSAALVKLIEYTVPPVLSARMSALCQDVVTAWQDGFVPNLDDACDRFVLAEVEAMRETGNYSHVDFTATTVCDRYGNPSRIYSIQASYKYPVDFIRVSFSVDI